jgi:hypothetical protein
LPHDEYPSIAIIILFNLVNFFDVNIGKSIANYEIQKAKLYLKV